MHKMMAMEEEHVYRSTRLPNAIVERRRSRLSPLVLARDQECRRPSRQGRVVAAARPSGLVALC